MQKTIHRLKPDMIGVNVPSSRPAELLHRRGRRRPHGVRLGADDQVFAVGFVPDGHHVRAVLRRKNAGAQLRLRLLRKAVAHTEGIFAEFEMVLIHLNGGSNVAKAEPRPPSFSRSPGN